MKRLALKNRNFTVVLDQAEFCEADEHKTACRRYKYAWY
jgi:hypothetical protein